MKNEEDSIGDEERRFSLMKMPDDDAWPCKLPESLLSKADPETREYFVQMDRSAQKQDWLINEMVRVNNACYYMESDVIRSRKFRTGFLIRWATLNLVLGAVIGLLSGPLKDYLLPKHQNEPDRNQKGSQTP